MRQASHKFVKTTVQKIASSGKKSFAMGSIESQDSLYGLATIPKAPADFLMGMKHDFLADESTQKVALVVGAYRDDKGRPWRLPAVIEVSVVGVFERCPH